MPVIDAVGAGPIGVFLKIGIDVPDIGLGVDRVDGDLVGFGVPGRAGDLDAGDEVGGDIREIGEARIGGRDDVAFVGGLSDGGLQGIIIDRGPILNGGQSVAVGGGAFQNRPLKQRFGFLGREGIDVVRFGIGDVFIDFFVLAEGLARDGGAIEGHRLFRGDEVFGGLGGLQLLIFGFRDVDGDALLIRVKHLGLIGLGAEILRAG